MVVPGRAIASGHLREDGEVFVGKRCRDAALLDFHESLHRVHDDNPVPLAKQLIQQIQELNRDENVHGIIARSHTSRLSTAEQFCTLLVR